MCHGGMTTGSCLFRLKLEDVSEDLRDAVITAWRVPLSGDVEKGGDLLEVVTDKASFDVPSPCDGKLVRILKDPGSTVSGDEIIAEIATREHNNPCGIPGK